MTATTVLKRTRRLFEPDEAFTVGGIQTCHSNSCIYVVSPSWGPFVVEVSSGDYVYTHQVLSIEKDNYLTFRTHHDGPWEVKIKNLSPEKRVLDLKVLVIPTPEENVVPPEKPGLLLTQTQVRWVILIVGGIPLVGGVLRWVFGY